MPTIFETRWFRRHWGWRRTNESRDKTSNYGLMEPNWENIDAVTREFSEELNVDGWEIKAVVPLLSSEYQTTALINSTGTFQGAWGGGHGYGATFSDGMVLLCQRAIQLTDEEYQQRQLALTAARNRKAQRKAEADAIRQMPIRNISKGVFKPLVFMFDESEYASQNEAETAREAKAKNTEEAE